MAMTTVPPGRTPRANGSRTGFSARNHERARAAGQRAGDRA